MLLRLGTVAATKGTVVADDKLDGPISSEREVSGRRGPLHSPVN